MVIPVVNVIKNVVVKNDLEEYTNQEINKKEEYEKYRSPFAGIYR